MKNKLTIASFILIFATGCATVPSQEANSYEKVRTCGNNELKINFFVQNPSDQPDEDIFTKKLLIKIKVFKSKYGPLILWLYYNAANPSEKRSLPESAPDKITVQKKSVITKIPGKKFVEIWNEFMTPTNLTLIENCLFN